jgi:peptide/nickel transport system ATP-binding protein
MAPEPSGATLRAESLHKVFNLRGRDGARRLHAVSGVSLELRAGRVLALVGESGCGKSTVARLLARLYPATSGRILLHDDEVARRGERGRRRYASQVQIILQDPFASLNSAYDVRHHLVRPLTLHRNRADGGRSLQDDALRLLEEVNLTPARDFLERYPHELSGGQRQRVSIARALAVNPEVLLADEPVSMLDVSIRLEILRLLGRLVAERDLAMLYITHDIASARYFAADIAVMYAGEIVEFGPAEAVTQEPMHPYTQLLLAAVPDPERVRTAASHERMTGEAPDLSDPPPGCRFHPRCAHAGTRCRVEVPPAAHATDGEGQWARCLLYDEAGVGVPLRAAAPGDGSVSPA